MPTQTLINATLETIGRPKQSKFENKPNYRPLLFTLPDGSQRWKSYAVDAQELTWLTRGQTYQAVISGDDFNIVQPSGAAPAPAPAPGATIPADQKRAIATYIQEQSKLFGYCYQQAQAELPGLSEESHRAIAETLYIQAARKFQL
ncbi:MAG: hypothetical protein WBA57_27530 [Elainellaceae cyanobacterium]